MKHETLLFDMTGISKVFEAWGMSLFLSTK